MATAPNIATLDESDARERLASQSPLRKALLALWRDRLSMVALGILLLLAFLSLMAPVITNVLNVSATDTNAFNRFAQIGAEGHPLGTDELGRDMLARLLFAGRVSLGIGFFGAIFALVIGLSFGSVTGYFGGPFDDFMNWVITTVDSIPGLYLLILIGAVLTFSPTSLVLVVALIGWTGTARLMRGQTLQQRGLEYVLGAKAAGATDFYVIFIHIVPNLVSFTAVTLTRGIGGLILAESGLSFLGLGVRPPAPTWGNMLTDSQQYYATEGAAHFIFLPGMLIFVTVLCLYVLGDGVRDAFDPQTRTD